MEPYGDTSKTLFLNKEMNKLHLEFSVGPKTDLIDLNHTLVAQDTVKVFINGELAADVDYASSHGATMTAIAAAIEDSELVDSASVSATNVFSIVPLEGEEPKYVVTLNGEVVEGITYGLNGVRKGQAVKLAGNGEDVIPLVSGDDVSLAIGYSIHDGVPGRLVTIAMRGFMVIFARAAATVVPGRATVTGYDSTNSRPTYSNTSSSGATIGWVLDAGDQGDEIRVVLSA